MDILQIVFCNNEEKNRTQRSTKVYSNMMHDARIVAALKRHILGPSNVSE